VLFEVNIDRRGVIEVGRMVGVECPCGRCRFIVISLWGGGAVDCRWSNNRGCN